MSAPDPRRDQIATVLIEHTRTSIENCHCGWGADFTKLGQSHPYHVAEQLQPIIDAAVGQARAETAEEIAWAIGQEQDSALMPAADIAREHGTRP